MNNRNWRRAAIILLGSWTATAGLGCTGLSAEARKDLQMAYENYSSGQYDTCARQVEQFFAKYGQTPAAGEAHHLQGICYMHLKQREKARAALVEATKAEAPAKVKRAAYTALGNLCFEDRRYEEAIPYYEEALKDFPNESPKEKVLYRLGYSLQMVGQWQRADRFFSQLRRNFAQTPEGKQAAELFGHRHFYVQAGAYERRASALALQARLREWNLPVTVVPRFGQGKAYYVVGIGHYRTYRQAEEAFKQMKAHLGQTTGEAIIRSGF